MRRAGPIWSAAVLPTVSRLMWPMPYQQAIELVPEDYTAYNYVLLPSPPR